MKAIPMFGDNVEQAVNALDNIIEQLLQASARFNVEPKCCPLAYTNMGHRRAAWLLAVSNKPRNETLIIEGVYMRWDCPFCHKRFFQGSKSTL